MDTEYEFEHEQIPPLDEPICSDVRLGAVYAHASLGLAVPAADVRAVLDRLAFQERALREVRRMLDDAERHIRALDSSYERTL